MTDPAESAQIGRMLDRIAAATERLIATASRLTDEQVRAPSPLPGWTRGHVLNHLARNADGLRDLLFGAKTGIALPQYPSQDVRDAEIEAGATRPASEIATDLANSAAAFAAQAGELDRDAWLAEVRGMRGPAHPAWFTLHRRLTEVEVHHVDLAAGYTPADWPEPFVADLIDRVTAGLAEDEQCPSVMLVDSGTGRQYVIGAGAPPERAVSGPAHELAAWLIGRYTGAGLAADPPGALPELPSY
ncbi:MAG: maleylpyruvate isomerase family mycothiol-dependent enzyme [Actinomycetota bacterium]|nr:maleylpyruvate isomerase family mycothiol-dependent enzyme [Actinomycetota bacterium]